MNVKIENYNLKGAETKPYIHTYIHASLFAYVCIHLPNVNPTLKIQNYKKKKSININSEGSILLEHAKQN